MFFRFPPGISISAKSCPGPKGPKNPYLAISRPWGSGWPKRETPKSCAIFGRNFWSGRISPPKVPLAPGNCIVVFSARAQNFSTCSRSKRAKIPLNHRFRPVGVQPEIFWHPIKLRKTIPDSVSKKIAKSATSTGKLCFSVFGPGPEFLQVPQVQNRPKYH